MDFKLNLSGNMQQQANADAAALEKLNQAIVSEQKALGAMEKQMRAIQKAGTVDIQVFRALSGAIQQQKDKVAALTAQQVAAGQAGLKHSEAMKAQTGSSGALASFLGNTLAQAFTKLISVIGAAAAAVVEFAEARGDATRMLETVFRSEKAAENTYSAIIDVTKHVAITQEKAIEVADALTKAGEVNGDRMVRSIEAVGKAEAARKGAGDAIQGIIERANKSKWFSVSRDELRAAGLTFKDLATTISKQTGQGVQQATLALRAGRVSMKAGLEALTTTVDKTLGPIAQKKFMTIGVQSEKLKATFGRLFDAVDTSKVAAVLAKIATWLDEGSVAGYTLKEALTGIFDAMGDAVEAVWPYVQTYFEYLILTALKIYNAFFPVRQALSNLFGSGADVASFESILLGFSEVVGVAFQAVGVTIAILINMIDGLVEALLWMAGMWDTIFSGIADFFTSIDWGELALDIVRGLVSGILGGIPLLVDAFGKLGSMGLEKFKGFFGIHSPSTVMAVQGKYLDQGLEKGIEDNAAGPTNALGGAAGSPGAIVTNSTDNSRTSGGSVVFSEGAIVLNFTGGGDAAEQVRAQMPQLMADIFEQLGLTMGAEGSAA